MSQCLWTELTQDALLQEGTLQVGKQQPPSGRTLATPAGMRFPAGIRIAAQTGDMWNKETLAISYQPLDVRSSSSFH